MNYSNKILENFFSISFGRGVGLVLNLLTFVLIARYLSLEEFGTFSLFIAVIGILSKVIDFGISPIVFRESSRKDDSTDLLNTAISVRLFLFISIDLLANLYIFITSSDPRTLLLFNIIIINILFSAKFANIRDLLMMPFKVHLQMKLPSILSILDASIFLISVLLIPIFQDKLVYLASIYVLSNLPGFILQTFFIIRNYRFSFHFSTKQFKWLLKESMPLAGFVFFMAVFQQIDLLFLNSFKGAISTGLYSSALRLTSPLLLIPTALVTTVFPLILKEEINRQKLIRGVYKILFFISTVIAVIFGFKSTEIISLIFSSKYALADAPSTLLFVSQIFFFINFFTLSLFTADNKQKINFFYSLNLVFLNILFDVILIPHYSILGAALAKLIAIIGGFIFVLFFINKVNSNWNFITKKYLLWLVFIGLGAYAVSQFSMLIYIPVVSIIVFIVTWLTSYFDKEEINFLLLYIK